MRHIIGIGETILDLVFENNHPRRAVAGGSTFNCMVSLGRCGLPAQFISELGKDKVGELILAFMRENKLTTDYVAQFSDGQSPVSLAFLDEQRNADYEFYTRYPDKRLDIAFPTIAKDDVVIFGSFFAINPQLRPRVKALLDYARQQGAIIYYDINFRRAHAGKREQLMPYFLENFAYATVVRCSDEDLELLFPGQDFAAVYRDYFAQQHKTLIVTQGGQGVWVKTPQFERQYPVAALEPVSTIGAGDNFNAGFIYELCTANIGHAADFILSDAQWEGLIDRANRFAAEVCLSWDNYVSWEFSTKLQ